MRVCDVTIKGGPLYFPEAIWSVHCGRADHKKGIDNTYDILEIFGGYDTETTNIRQADGWAAYVYHFQISLANQRETVVYLFRKWEVFLWFIDELVKNYKLGEKRKLILWVANFSFEFQFLRERLEWDSGEWDFFAKEERQPLKATYHGLEFREALAISGGDLAHLAKTYCKTQKLVGDLDYSVERNFSTELDEKARAYVINDVVILSEFSERMFKDYIRPHKKVPMTKTSILIDEYKRNLKRICKERDERLNLENGESLRSWMDFIHSCQPDEKTYKTWFTYLFRGGYVHANALYSDIEVRAVPRDITSSYPAYMLLGYVPVTPFKKVKFTPELLNNKCCILRVQYDFIEQTTPHSIESKNKIVSVVNGVYDNGRLVSCDSCELWQTEHDYKVFNLFYRSKTGQPPTVVECYIADRGEIPPYVTDVVKKYYLRKNELKANGQKKTQEYSVCKAALNSNYGACVKKIRLQRVNYNHGWSIDSVSADYYKEIEKTILLPQWGIWITAGSRCQFLLNTLYKLTRAGVECVYLDTDSIKYRPCHKAEKIFQHYNNSIRRHLHNRGLRNKHFSDLGMYDVEERDKNGRPLAVRMKTLGAKRYICEIDGEVIATVAGMPKMSIKQLGETVDEIFENFNFYGYALTPDMSGKLTTKYRDTPHEALVGYPFEKMRELSSVALYQIPFTMSLGPEYIAYCAQVQKEHKEDGRFM